MTSSALNRTLLKLENHINTKNFYEAHQLYRTLYFRLKSDKKNQGDIVELLSKGATRLFENGQAESATDLALLLVDFLREGQLAMSADIIEKLGCLHKLFDRANVDRPLFRSKAIDWLQQGKDFIGCQKLNHAFALTLWDNKEYSDARHYFIRAGDGKTFALMLIEYSEQGYPLEADLFITQSVLQILCLSEKNVSFASITFSTYAERHPDIRKGPPFLLPLLNFLWLLLIAVEKKLLAAFGVLIEKYAPSLSRDPSYRDYLDKIGQIYFKMPPPEGTGREGGLLDNIMQGFFGDSMAASTNNNEATMELD